MFQEPFLSSEGASSGRGYVWLLRNREYQGLLFSNFVSLMGDQLSRVAIVVLVYQRTDSPLWSSATYAATFLPVVVGAPLLGGLADRLPRRRVLIVGDLLRAGLLALMALPGMPLWVLVVLLMLTVTVEAPYNAARGPLMRDILLDDQGYQLGTSVDETLYTSGQILGFVAAGALLTVFTPSTALALDAFSFLVAAVVVRVLVQHRGAADVSTEGESSGEGGRASLRSRARRGVADAALGFRVAMAPACRRPLLLTWAGISFGIAPEALAVPWADELGAGAVGLGMLYAAGASGAVVGMLVLGRVSVERGQRLLLPLAVLTLLPLVFAPAASQLATAFLLVFIAGVGSAYSMLARVAFVRGVEDAHRGRAFAVASAGVTAGQGIGVALVGAVATLTNSGTSIAIASGLGLLLVAVVAATSPDPLSTTPILVPEERSIPNDEIAAEPTWPGITGLPPDGPSPAANPSLPQDARKVT